MIALTLFVDISDILKFSKLISLRFSSNIRTRKNSGMSSCGNILILIKKNSIYKSNLQIKKRL